MSRKQETWIVIKTEIPLSSTSDINNTNNYKPNQNQQIQVKPNKFNTKPTLQQKTKNQQEQKTTKPTTQNKTNNNIKPNQQHKTN